MAENVCYSFGRGRQEIGGLISSEICGECLTFLVNASLWKRQPHSPHLFYARGFGAENVSVLWSEKF